LRNRRLILRLHYYLGIHILGASRGGPCDSTALVRNPWTVHRLFCLLSVFASSRVPVVARQIAAASSMLHLDDYLLDHHASQPLKLWVMRGRDEPMTHLDARHFTHPSPPPGRRDDVGNLAGNATAIVLGKISLFAVVTQFDVRVSGRLLIVFVVCWSGKRCLPLGCRIRSPAVGQSVRWMRLQRYRRPDGLHQL